MVATTPTFGELADQIVSSLESGWRNEKHRKQWRMTLTRYAAPLRDKPVDTISVEHVLGVLMPLWTTRPATASRLRGRIEKVLDAATARGLRAGVNPAVWRGNLDHLLPRSKRLARVHHAALPFNEVPAFVSELSVQGSVVARALTFVILTGVRSGEALGARWDEIDPVTKVWTIPAARMKAGRAHRVPLSTPALALLRQMEQQRSGDLVSPGRGQESHCRAAFSSSCCAAWAGKTSPRMASEVRSGTLQVSKRTFPARSLRRRWRTSWATLLNALIAGLTP